MTTSLFLAFALGTPEMILIFALMLLLFGAKKIPELARGLGKGLGEFKKAKDEFEHEITRAATEPPRKDEKDDANKPA